MPKKTIKREWPPSWRSSKEAETKYAAAHPELVKKVVPPPVKPLEEEEKEEKKSGKEEDYEVIGTLIGQWNKMKRRYDARQQTEEAFTYYSDYLDTRDQYKAIRLR